MSKQICMMVNKIFNWSPSVDNSSIFTLQFYSNQTQELIIQKKVQGVYSLNSMFLNSALRINYIDEERQVLLKIQFADEQICSFCIDLIILKEKRVQYFPFPGKDKVLQINLTDFDQYQNRLKQKEKNIQDFPAQNLHNHRNFIRQRESFIHNSYVNQQKIRRNFSQNINRLLSNMNTPKTSINSYYRVQREDKQQEKNHFRANYREYCGYIQNSNRGSLHQRNVYQSNHYGYNQPQSNYDEFDDYDVDRIRNPNHNRNPMQRETNLNIQKEIELQKRLPRASSERIYYMYLGASPSRKFIGDAKNRQKTNRQQIHRRNYQYPKSQRDREQSKQARSSTSAKHKLMLNTLNVVPKQEYFVQKGNQLRRLYKNSKEMNQQQPNSEYFNSNKKREESVSNKLQDTQENLQKHEKKLESQQNMVHKQQRSVTLDKAKQKQQNIQKLISQMSKHYQFQQKLKKIQEHRKQIHR